MWIAYPVEAQGGGGDGPVSTTKCANPPPAKPESSESVVLDEDVVWFFAPPRAVRSHPGTSRRFVRTRTVQHAAQSRVLIPQNSPFSQPLLHVAAGRGLEGETSS